MAADDDLVIDNNLQFIRWDNNSDSVFLVYFLFRSICFSIFYYPIKSCSSGVMERGIPRPFSWKVDFDILSYKIRPQRDVNRKESFLGSFRVVALHGSANPISMNR